ncbi:MAG TPA: type VI secretion system contractile sheath large subunit [Polyangia bacterium]|nr:type VI secretion system contractile sheath large subunit [Polyangia bacterium]
MSATMTMEKTNAVESERPAAYVDRFLSSMRLELSRRSAEPQPMIKSDLTAVENVDAVSAEDRFVSGLAAVLYNIDHDAGRFDKGDVMAVVARIDELIASQVNAIIHQPEFQKLEANWRGVEDLVRHTNFRANITIDLLDVTKREIDEDFENNSASVFGSALFRKLYVAEYDQYGGRPFGALVGLYEFENTPRDLFWLRSMGKVANASHAPFMSAVSPKFFGCQTVEEVEAIQDLSGLLAQPKYSQWSSFRDSEESAYIGLTFPRYVARLPWNPESNPCYDLNFTEDAQGESSRYVWGNAALLLARNLHRSFERSGWCQHIRGPKGGGTIQGLPVDTFRLAGEDDMMPPVELAIPDYRELEFAHAGFIPLIHRKHTGDATFFSTQSVKRAKKFKDPKDSENAQMVCNLAYTFSITRIAHYIKCIMRDNIGSSADENEIKRIITNWLGDYCTKLDKPDVATVQRYPFKATRVEVVPRPGEIGWYDCQVSILPHIQFEGMNVELRLESRLGAANGET